MKNISLFFAFLLIVFLAVNVRANPKNTVKNSPLFKASLQHDIDKMEGKNLVDENGNVLSTSSCTPNGIASLAPTCQPSVCGGGSTCQSTCALTCYECGPTHSSTCYSTCVSTCASTCQSTCQNTCNQNTCANTCAGGVCPYHYQFQGYSYWNKNGTRSHNWNELSSPYYKQNPGTTTITFHGQNPPPSQQGPWQISEGHYQIDFWYTHISNTFVVRSDIYMKYIANNNWTDFYSYVTWLSAPSHSDINYTDIDFDFNGYSD